MVEERMVMYIFVFGWDWVLRRGICELDNKGTMKDSQGTVWVYVPKKGSHG